MHHDYHNTDSFEQDPHSTLMNFKEIMCLINSNQVQHLTDLLILCKLQIYCWSWLIYKAIMKQQLQLEVPQEELNTEGLETCLLAWKKRLRNFENKRSGNLYRSESICCPWDFRLLWSQSIFSNQEEHDTFNGN